MPKTQPYAVSNEAYERVISASAFIDSYCYTFGLTVRFGWAGTVEGGRYIRLSRPIQRLDSLTLVMPSGSQALFPTQYTATPQLITLNDAVREGTVARLEGMFGWGDVVNYDEPFPQLEASTEYITAPDNSSLPIIDVGTTFVVDDEIISVKYKNADRLHLDRGIADTAIAAHTAKTVTTIATPPAMLANACVGIARRFAITSLDGNPNFSDDSGSEFLYRYRRVLDTYKRSVAI